jgi:pilus assembly protein CpaB
MRRVLGVLAGIVVAGFGAILLVNAVERQQDADEPSVVFTEVLVAVTPVPRLTPVAELANFVAPTEVPANLVAPGALISLDGLDPAFVALSEILPGEQVLAARFGDQRLLGRIFIPDGLVEVSVSMGADRALGGTLIAGETVGLLATFEPPLPAAPTAGDPTVVTAPTSFGRSDLPVACTGGGACYSDFVLHGALVTSVQYSGGDVAIVQQNNQPNEDGVIQAPTAQVLVTMAVPSADAAKVVFAAEFGRLWLTREGERSVTGGENPVTLDRLFTPS